MMISVPDNEYQARVELIAWLAYPCNPRLRNRAKIALSDLARYTQRMTTQLRRDRLEGALQRIDLSLNRHLLCGEVFRRQLFELRSSKHGLQTMFDSVSTKAFARRAADSYFRADEREARRMMALAAPILHLAVGACDGLAERPGILTRLAQGKAGQIGVKVPGLLLNDSRYWTARALGLAQNLKSEATELGHPKASLLADLSVFPLPPIYH